MTPEKPSNKSPVHEIPHDNRASRSQEACELLERLGIIRPWIKVDFTLKPGLMHAKELTSGIRIEDRARRADGSDILTLSGFEVAAIRAIEAHNGRLSEGSVQSPLLPAVCDKTGPSGS